MALWKKKNNTTRTNKAIELLNEKNSKPSKKVQICGIEIPELRLAKHLVREVMLKKTTSITLCSAGGLGKTFLVRQLAEEICKGKYIYHSGHITPLALYQLLYDNRDKIIILDDLEENFKNDIIIGILRSVTGSIDDKRIVSWGTTSEKIGDYPSSFEFTGGIISLCNKIPREREEHVRAFLTRSRRLDIIYTYNRILAIMNNIIDNASWTPIIGFELNEAQKEELKTKFNNSVSALLENFNFRTLQGYVIDTFYAKEYCPDEPDLADEILKATLKIDPDKEVVLDIINCGLKGTNAMNYFKEHADSKSKTTYYRLRGELEIQLGMKKKKVPNSHKKEIREEPETTDIIKVQNLLDIIDSLDLTIKKDKNGTYTIKNNGNVVTYVQDTKYGISYSNKVNGSWKAERITTQDQLDKKITELTEKYEDEEPDFTV